MPDSNDMGKRTSEYMTTPHSSTTQPEAQQETTKVVELQTQAPVQASAEVPGPASGLDPVTKLSNMVKVQIAASCAAEEQGTANDVPETVVELLTTVPAAHAPEQPAASSQVTDVYSQNLSPLEQHLSDALAQTAALDMPRVNAEDVMAFAPATAAAKPKTEAAAAEPKTEAAAAEPKTEEAAAEPKTETAPASATPASTFPLPAPEHMASPDEKPQNNSIPDLPAEQNKPQRPLSLFEPVEILRGGMMPEDLPFANEVDAALARRPLRKERYLSLAVGCGILLFILWAAFASIDEVTHAEGQVISSQRTQAIQNLEGGILRNILVSEGQTVEKGDVLAQLDNELAASSYRDAINKALDNTLAIIRLEAERKGEVPLFPENVEEWVQEVVGPQNMVTALPQAHQAIKDQMSAYQARTQQKNAELLLLESQYQQRVHEVGELSARKRQLDESLALAVEQRDIAAGLLQKRSTSRVDYLNQQQRVVQLSGEVEALASTIPKAQSAAQETEQRITFRKAEIDAAVTDELNKRRMDLASINETLSAGGDRVTRTELRSPVRGTVKRIAITTLGGVVKPGESIMEIVPLDDTLLVEAKVRPSDVAFLRPGQRAMVKVSAYDFSIYGGLEGALEQISADTIEDKRGEFHYLVKVRTNKTSIQHQDKSLPIIPGMMATVDILIGKKTVLDYLLKPILKARDRALRER